MIHFDHVGKRYMGAEEALSNISLHIDPGEMVFLIGRSGAGKSTLFKLIALMERPTHGQILINNQNLNSIRRRAIPHYRRRIGVIFQDSKLLYDRRVFDNIALPLIVSGFAHKEISRRVRAALDQVALLHKERDYPAALSGGEQQRVGIARAVVNKPSILIADEPTGNLDPALSVEIMSLFERFHQVGTTVMVASHDYHLVRHMGHRMISLNEGKLVNAGHY